MSKYDPKGYSSRTEYLAVLQARLDAYFAENNVTPETNQQRYVPEVVYQDDGRGQTVKLVADSNDSHVAASASERDRFLAKHAEAVEEAGGIVQVVD
ncbi:hypothetical protein JW898_03010 [Candidatus Woesearchaeota archaeon]|nr:hypothetical protein [Candidatus Woesearchaeota archaeon]